LHELWVFYDYDDLELDLTSVGASSTERNRSEKRKREGRRPMPGRRGRSGALTKRAAIESNLQGLLNGPG